MAVTPKQVIHAFPTPILVFHNPDHARDEADLARACLEARERHPGIHRSNLGGSWHSSDDLFKLKNPAFDPVRRFVQACVEGAFKSLETTGPVSMNVELYGWININPQHAYNKPHNHPESLLSGCYYVSVPPSTGMGGTIEFQDPRAGANMVSTPFAAFNPSLSIRPQAGQLLLFPSYLSHWVLPNEEIAERISIAFNVKAARKASTGRTEGGPA